MADFIDEYGEVLSGRAAFLERQKERQNVIDELRREWELEKDRKTHPYKYAFLLPFHKSVKIKLKRNLL